MTTEVSIDKSHACAAISEVAKALTSPRRLALMELLAQRERSVEALAEVAGLPLSTTSTHLGVLRRLGLVSRRREGTTVHYALAGDEVAGLLVALNTVAGHYPPVREIRSAAAHNLPVSARQAVTDPARYVVLDVRPAEEFAAGHLPGAWSIPLDDLARRAGELPVDRTVLLYCRGEFCTLAQAGATILREAGLQAHAIDEGVLEWRADAAVVLDVTA